MRSVYLSLAVFSLCVFSGGFLLGSRNAPSPVDSQLADAQVVAQDRDVRWVGYDCGDDHAVVIARQMPDINECRDIRRLRDDLEFPAPSRRTVA